VGAADLLRRNDDRWRGLAEQYLEHELVGVVDQPALRLLAEQLVLAPGRLLAAGRDLLAECGIFGARPGDLRDIRFCPRNNDLRAVLRYPTALSEGGEKRLWLDCGF
jgi:hypothetical protein